MATSATPQSPESTAANLASPVESDHEDDEDSTYDDDESSTRSMVSQLLKYREEHGRKYHSYEAQHEYMLPNDEYEKERLDAQHHLFKMTFNGNIYCCPAGNDKPVKRCLDAGTGTGIWAMEFADEHPGSEVLGVDLSPIQPEWVPPNLRFQVDDVEREWTFRPSSYDLIFGRMLRGSIHDWPRFFEQSFQTLDSEGWIEVQDICFPVRCDDGTLKADSYLARWSKCMIKATKADGRSIEATKADGCSAEGSLLYKSKLEAAGFINVKEFVYMWPMNWWPAREHYKDLGKWCYYNIAGGLSGISMRLFTKNLGWEQAEVEAFLAEVRKDMKDRNIHAWWPIHVAYGQKPLSLDE